jgi:hypothetical protein
MMAMDQKQRDAKAAAKRASVAEKELRHRVRPGIEKAVARIRKRGAGITTTELLQVAIMKMDLMDDTELGDFLKYPRHKIMVSQDVAQEIYQFGLRSVISNPDQDPDDEIVGPG